MPRCAVGRSTIWARSPWSRSGRPRRPTISDRLQPWRMAGQRLPWPASTWRARASRRTPDRQPSTGRPRPRASCLAYKALGDLYASGRGVPQDLPAAIRWYEQAKADGEPWAGFELAELYAGGRGVPADPVKAAALTVRRRRRGWHLPSAPGATCSPPGPPSKPPTRQPRWSGTASRRMAAMPGLSSGLASWQPRAGACRPTRKRRPCSTAGLRMPGSRQPRSRWAIST